METFNFSAGPGVLPTPVISQIKADLAQQEFSHLSMLEISHRSSQFEAIMNSAQQRLRQLMKIPADYEVAFIQGGGSLQFEMLPLNLATQLQKIAVLDSGNFAAKAAQAAQMVGKEVDIVASSKAEKYRYLPQLPKDFQADTYDYLHLITNNTIEGTAYHADNLPQTTGYLTADMSSNILAEHYDVRKFGAIFAGAQKNLGPAGVTIAIIKKDWLDEQNITGVGPMMRYQNYFAKNSMYNTPPVFAIYALDLVLKWVQINGGVSEMFRRNQEKASKLYDFLDESKLFDAPVKREDRSLTNVVFTTHNQDRDARIVSEATANGLFNLGGHRSVGGFRASLYNAQPMAAVDRLIEFLHTVEKGEL
ncbi:3-phosphoserine/phosphohydroxythreonine transaminase [Fructilactobacillus frigidiflavus]|uniref:3-phosphoserine/phosphohydroxythreonine transaminase n=1 Tax=Fructilactobacillus frigidiflavus TaxID=3242688 RepID=UPI003757C2A3